MRVLDDDAEHEFRAFVHAHKASLARTAYLLMNDAHLAEDLLQSVLANTALRWTSAVEHPEAYVRKALYHQAISWWRWRGRRPESLPGVLPEAARDRVDEVDRRIVVRAALAKLTPKQRAVLVLRYFDDLSEADAAEALGCSIGTVKSQTRRKADSSAHVLSVDAHTGRVSTVMTVSSAAGAGVLEIAQDVVQAGGFR